MPKSLELRKARFKAALALSRTTVQQWCDAHEITTGHLYQVLNGVRESPPLVAKIEAFTERYVPATEATARTA